ncbi:MAG: alanine--tRNA ligase [Planctomycetaceae bacterium]|nr:alanine--tRNA ligase [Planctomycetaceae bacterium]
MKTDELREKYLAFFETKGCVRRSSDVLIPKDDPTVLFTPAGMNQFKNQFLGIGPLEFTKATTSQKCLRTGDIGNVGITAYHHTFFEMLGNFSFGDYFKREAIHWAWEFLTSKQWLGLDAERLTVTVYLDDDEAFDIWNKEIKLPAERISRCDESENFWPASSPSQGPDGVCGPCSEIYYLAPGATKPVEIWNLVFTQFNRVGDPPNNLHPLPKKNIDTGMGLERCASCLQGVLSNFEIDILKPMCIAAGDALGLKYSYDAAWGRACRRIADHVRACTFAIHEGAVPGPEKADYIVRLLLRRAAMEGYLLGRKQPFLHTLVPAIVAGMKHPYPEITETVQSVSNVIKLEEEQFLDVVDRGMPRFEKLANKAKSSGVISGEDAFDLQSTYGFLIELTETLATEKGLKVDYEGYTRARKRHELTSGSGAFADSVMSAGPIDSLKKQGGTKFLGYESLTSDARIVGIISNKELVTDFTVAGHEQPIGVALNQTPFYAESGGQVGDVGLLIGDGVEFSVADTQKDGDLWIHVGHLTKGKLYVGQAVTATVDDDRRSGIRRAHSATHILHHALHCTVGKNATQRGSKVQQDELRFDFAHNQALTPDEIRQVEDIINECVAKGAPVSTELLPIEEARKKGAMALFGEKYPDEVRVVSMGDFSVELCGGTHLSNTGQVGLCRITSEEPIAKGVRRITAITGPKAVQKGRDTDELVAQLQRLLKSPQPAELITRVEALQNEVKTLSKQIADMTSASVADAIGGLVAQAEVIGGVKLVAKKLEGVNRDALRDFADQLRDKHSPVALILGAEIEGKVALIAAVSKPLVKDKNLHAGNVVKAAATIAGGGGGGRPDMAEAGARLVEKLDEAIAAGAAELKKQLG